MSQTKLQQKLASLRAQASTFVRAEQHVPSVLYVSTSDKPLVLVGNWDGSVEMILALLAGKAKVEDDVINELAVIAKTVKAGVQEGDEEKRTTIIVDSGDEFDDALGSAAMLFYSAPSGDELWLADVVEQDGEKRLGEWEPQGDGSRDSGFQQLWAKRQASNN